ncbi:peptide-methionine (S)-S-oxide reductase MsrA [Novosphingobium sp. TH158]|uniref:peptide-methionine (S)-S-oxide reductase MsrA n=1 Tax=Novosphingobium sp. TH158 TaxID=2067455 RepID=UPI000C7CEA20|nr:peptide-methionine (S)-S-oxide reductase MsrA [Novosphingobium sp. TH158]PLK24502.1 peptide-methionine (S)-S-oxide reductase [Novosphingobium sp. TH158]
MAEAIFAGGCFWCTEAVFRSIAGVSAVESGYIGGTVPNPTYKQVCTGTTGHAEAIRIAFDPEVVSYADLLDIHMATHDPTQLNRQGNDVGTQYRSALFPLDEVQHAEAEDAITRWNAAHDKIAVTTIEGPAEWFPAEDYHQEYWQGEGQRNPYCLAVIPPKLAKLQKGFSEKLKD